MKNVITAIGNENIINILYKIPEINFLNSDILYREGILEVLEYKENADILIINNIIDGDIELKDLINKILIINNKIKIIYLTNNIDYELEKFLKNKKVDLIYYQDEIDVNELIGRLCFDNKKLEVKSHRVNLENKIIEQNCSGELCSSNNNDIQFVGESIARPQLQRNIQKNTSKNKHKKRRIRNKINKVIDFIARNTWRRKYRERRLCTSENNYNYKKKENIKYKSNLPKVRSKVINKKYKTIVKIEIN